MVIFELFLFVSYLCYVSHLALNVSNAFRHSFHLPREKSMNPEALSLIDMAR